MIHNSVGFDFIPGQVDKNRNWTLMNSAYLPATSSLICSL